MSGRNWGVNNGTGSYLRKVPQRTAPQPQKCADLLDGDEAHAHDVTL